MKKLYRKGTVHPSPPIISDHLSFLPAAILTLTVALSPEDREVLAYLISCSNNNGGGSQGHRKSTQQQKNGSVSFAKSKSTGNNNNNNNDHPPLFTCDCFRCYMSYWVKWDASPNRHLIHEIIDAIEDHEMMLYSNKKVKNNKKDKKKRCSGNDHHQLNDQRLLAAESESVEENRDGDGEGESCNNNGGGGGGGEKGSVRSFVSYIGERIWGVWGE